MSTKIFPCRGTWVSLLYRYLVRSDTEEHLLETLHSLPSKKSWKRRQRSYICTSAHSGQSSALDVSEGSYLQKLLLWVGSKKTQNMVHLGVVITNPWLLSLGAVLAWSSDTILIWLIDLSPHVLHSECYSPVCLLASPLFRAVSILVIT